MKRFKQVIALLSIFIISIGLYSCESMDNKETPIISVKNIKGADIIGFTTPSVEIVDSATVSWQEHYESMMRESLEEGQTRSTADNDLFIFAKEQLKSIDSLTIIYQDSIAKTEGKDKIQSLRASGKNPLLGYKYLSMNYQSVDMNGNPITLSQLVVYPYSWFFRNPAPNNIVIGCHVTITSDDESPSKYKKFLSDVGMLVSHAKKIGNGYTSDNLVVIPDYEGYGVSSSKAHPYLSRDLTARQVVDGVIAAKNWYEKNVRSLSPNWKSFSVGYSQGGAVSMSVHRYLEKNGLDDDLRFVGSISGDGPYDIEETMHSYINEGKVYMPASVALMIKGLCETNPYLLGKYQPADFFTESFLKSGIMEMIQNKKYSTKDIQNKMLDYSWSNKNGFYMMGYAPVRKSFLKYTKEASRNILIWNAKNNAGSYAPLDLVVRPELIDFIKRGKTEPKYQEKMTALLKAMRMNKVLDDWKPRNPLILFHSKKDEVVPFVNYQNASKFFSKDILRAKIYDTYTYTHVGSGIAFYLKHEPNYVNSLLSNTWTKEPFEVNIDRGAF